MSAVTAARVEAGAFQPAQLVRALPQAVRKLDPRTMWHSPVMLVVEVGAVMTTVIAVLEPDVFAWSIAVWLWLTVVFANLAEAVAEGRGKAQADTLRKARTGTIARRLRADGTEEQVAATELHDRRPGRRRGRRHHPGRRRRDRGRRQRGRVGHHRRVGSRDPRVRRRPVGGHGRDQGALRPGRHPDHHEARRDLHRPDDRLGGRCRTAEDPQRDRAEHPARGAVDHLHPGGGHAAAAGDLLRRRAVPHRARRPRGLPDPHDDRCACSRPSASPAWTGSCSATSWRCPAAPSRLRATSAPCCSTRPGPSRWATGRPPSSSPSAPSPMRRSPTRPSSRAWPTRHPRGVRSWCSRRRRTDSVNATRAS